MASSTLPKATLSNGQNGQFPRANWFYEFPLHENWCDTIHQTEAKFSFAVLKWLKYSKLLVIQHQSTQNSQPINKNFKENFHFLWRCTKKICNMHTLTCHEVVLPGNHEQDCHRITEQDRWICDPVVLHISETFHLSNYSIAWEDSNTTTKVKACVGFLQVSLMQLPSHISHTCFLQMGS